MSAIRKSVIVFVALALVLGAVSVLAYAMYDALSPKQVAVPYWSDADERAVYQVRMRRRVHLAQIPWTLDLKNPEEALVTAAALPWISRPLPGADGAGPVNLAAAMLPVKFPRRVAVDEPLPATLASAAMPWADVRPGERPVTLVMATIPPMKRRPNPDKPDAVAIDTMRVPWVRGVAVLEPASVRLAEIPPMKAIPTLNYPAAVDVKEAKLPWVAGGPPDANAEKPGEASSATTDPRN